MARRGPGGGSVRYSADGDLHNILQRIDGHLGELEDAAEGGRRQRKAGAAEGDTNDSGRRRAWGSQRRRGTHGAGRTRGTGESGSHIKVARAGSGGGRASSRLADELREAKQRIADLGRRLEHDGALRQRLDHARAEFNRDRAAAKATTLNLRRQLAQAQAERADLQARLDAAGVAERQLREEVAALRRARRERNEAREKVEMQNTVMEKLRARLAQYATEVVNGDNDKLALRRQLDAEVEQHSATRKRCGMLDGARHALAAQVAQLQASASRAEQLAREKDALLQFADEARDTIKDLKAKVASLKTERDAREEQQDADRRRAERLDRQLQQLQATVNELQGGDIPRIRARAREADEMEAVQVELLDTVAKQAEQVATLRRQLTSALASGGSLSAMGTAAARSRRANVSFHTLDASGISVIDTSGVMDGGSLAGADLGSPVRGNGGGGSGGGVATAGEKSRLVNALVGDLERRVAALNAEVVELRSWRQRLDSFEREMGHVLENLRRSHGLTAASGAGGDAPDGAASLASLQLHAMWANSKQLHSLLPNTGALAALLHSAHALQTEALTNELRTDKARALQHEQEVTKLSARIREMGAAALVRTQSLEDAQAELVKLNKARAKQSQQIAELMAERDALASARIKLQEQARSLQVAAEQQEAHARHAAKNADLEAQELRSRVVQLQSHLSALSPPPSPST